MLLNILFLSFVFILGLISTFFGFPRKKIVAWFHSLTVVMSNNSTTATSTSVAAAAAAGKSLSLDDADRSKVMQRSRFSRSDENKAELKRVFATFDKNSDGYITKQELRLSLRIIGISVAEGDVEDMVARVDANGDGLIDFDEFCELFGSMMKGGGGGATNDEESDAEKDLKEAFDVFDGDGDGVITVEELGLVLSSLGFKEGNRLESCREMISRVDIDGDGMVNYDEFKNMMKAGGNLLSVS